MRHGLFMLLTAIVLAGCFTTAEAQSTAVTVDDVVAMLDAKLPEQVIIIRIKTQGKALTLSTDDLVRLKKAGASETMMLMMLNPSSEAAPAAALKNEPPSVPSAEANPFTEVGVYFKKAGQWVEVLPEIVNWKTGGVLKSMASAGIVKKDINGHLPGPHSRTSVAAPLEFMIYAPEGVAMTEYQLIRLRSNKDNREFRTVTGGVFNAKSGAMRDIVPFDGKKTAPRLYSISLGSSIGPGEYGFIYLGATGGAGGLTSLAMGKMYTFRFLE